jgi:hypothetical protein
MAADILERGINIYIDTMVGPKMLSNIWKQCIDLHSDSWSIVTLSVTTGLNFQLEGKGQQDPEILLPAGCWCPVSISRYTMPFLCRPSMVQSLQSHTFFCTWEEIFLTERSQHCFECLTFSHSNYNQHMNAESDWTFQDMDQKHPRLSTHKQLMGDAAGQELLSSLYSNNVRTLMPIVTANTLNHQVSTRSSGNYLSLPLYTWPSSTLLTYNLQNWLQKKFQFTELETKVNEESWSSVTDIYVGVSCGS